MGTEIERKFLVVGDDWRAGASGTTTFRAICRETARSFVFGKPAPAYLTIKGIAEGMSRPEFEYSIPLSDAQQLMNLCLRPHSKRTRYVIKWWQALGSGRISRRQPGPYLGRRSNFRAKMSRLKSPWIGQEVSGDPRYF